MPKWSRAPSPTMDWIGPCAVPIIIQPLRTQFAEPTAQGVLDPPASPVFAYYSTVFFDNMAPPWGIRWRKCDPRRSADALPTLRRRSPDAPSMFPEASKNRAKKTLISDTFFSPFWLHLASKFWQFWHHFSHPFLNRCSKPFV